MWVAYPYQVRVPVLALAEASVRIDIRSVIGGGSVGGRQSQRPVAQHRPIDGLGGLRVEVAAEQNGRAGRAARHEAREVPSLLETQLRHQSALAGF